MSVILMDKKIIEILISVTLLAEGMFLGIIIGMTALPSIYKMFILLMCGIFSMCVIIITRIDDGTIHRIIKKIKA